MKEEWHGVPEDVRPILEKIISELGKLTVLEQESVLEMLATRHIVRRAYPDKSKIKVIFTDMVVNILDMIKISAVETVSASKNKS